jgi:hypothetical protein
MQSCARLGLKGLKYGRRGEYRRRKDDGCTVGNADEEAEDKSEATSTSPRQHLFMETEYKVLSTEYALLVNEKGEGSYWKRGGGQQSMSEGLKDMRVPIERALLIKLLRFCSAG